MRACSANCVIVANYYRAVVLYLAVYILCTVTSTLLIIHVGTRETAFLNAIISAGIAREVARKCREAELDACNCDFSVESSRQEEGDDIITVYGGCGDNDEFGVEIAKAFTDKSISKLNDAFSLMSLHNNKVGRAVSS